MPGHFSLILIRSLSPNPLLLELLANGSGGSNGLSQVAYFVKMFPEVIVRCKNMRHDYMVNPSSKNCAGSRHIYWQVSHHHPYIWVCSASRYNYNTTQHKQFKGGVHYALKHREVILNS